MKPLTLILLFNGASSIHIKDVKKTTLLEIDLNEIKLEKEMTPVKTQPMDKDLALDLDDIYPGQNSAALM